MYAQKSSQYTAETEEWLFLARLKPIELQKMSILTCFSKISLMHEFRGLNDWAKINLNKGQNICKNCNLLKFQILKVRT